MSVSEELSRKKKVRNGHRSSTKRTISAVTELLTSVGEKTDLLAPHVPKLTRQKKTLEEKRDVLKEQDEAILALVGDDDIDLEIEQADILRERMQLTIIEIETALNGFNKLLTKPAVVVETSLLSSTPVETPSPILTAQNGNTTQPSFQPNQASVPSVKLPKLNLKKFRGDITTWSTFWDTFESSIDKNPTLSSIDKFNYLNSLLEHTAADAIAGLTLTAVNYQEAIDILKKRFGNKQLAINKHMDILLNLDPVASKYNLKGLRTLYDTVESHIRALKSLGVPSQSYGSLLCSMLMNKLPQELRILVSREVKNDDWDLDRLLKLVEGEIEARERASSHVNSSNSPHNQPKGQGKLPPSAAALHTGSFSPTCTYCQGSHTSNSCTTVSNVTARKDILRKNGRCFLCLKRNHLSRDCNSKSHCFKCHGRHHISICTKDTNEQKCQKPQTTSDGRPTQPDQGLQTRQPTGSESKPNEQQTGNGTTLFVSSKTPVLLQTAQATILRADTPRNSAKVRVILDSGSQRSYITNRVRNLLKLPTEETETMLIKTFGSDEEKVQTCDSVKFVLKSQHDQAEINLSAFAVPMICEPLQHQLISQAQRSYDHLHNLILADSSVGLENSEVDILIGCDQYWDLVTGEVRRGENGPTAIHTRLGWVVSGPVERALIPPSFNPATNLATTHVLRCAASPSQIQSQGIDKELRNFWDLESLGILREERSVHDEFTSTITFKDGRYEVNLPWKEQHPILPDNYEMSRKRLMNLLQRLQQEPDVLKEYDAVIKDQLNRGIVEVVEKEDVGEMGKVHYIPHHAVIRRDKQTTKLRIVYDASAKTSGPSLNDCLYTGPAMTQSILDIILRFRSHRVALAGDIEKAFLMVSISEADRNVLRFLWFDNVLCEQPQIIVLRFTRVVFGVSSSPFLLNATIRHHIEQYRSQDSEFVEGFLRAIYVDDLNSGGSDDESVYTLYKKAKLRLAEGGFNLRKFVTNSMELMKRIEDSEATQPDKQSQVFDTSEVPEQTHDAINEEDETYSKITLGTTDGSSGEEQRVLGVNWNFTEDQLVFDLSSIAELAKNCEPTKRNIVRLSAKFYDPLGFMSPITIQFKMMFQELCESKIGWDEKVEHSTRTKWKKLVAELLKMSRILLPRCYFCDVNEQVISCTIHGFCDASKHAYAAVTYLVIRTDSGTQVRFLASKTRVAPIDKQTIPRLELLSCLILARLLKDVEEALQHELQLKDSVCWSDSKVALFWIKSEEKEWKQFVQNRVTEIRSLVPPSSWRHCPGRDNPADIPSRGIRPSELANNRRWSSGPDWLAENESEAPTDEEEKVVPQDECFVEMKATKLPKSSTLTLTNSSQTISQIIKCERFGTLQRLLRVTAYVLRFVKAMKAVIKGSSGVQGDSLSANEIDEAEYHWVKEVQRSLPDKKDFQRWKAQFGLYTDEKNVWRCGGRLTKANLPFTTKHPILLDQDHYLTTLIILECHRKVMHNGVKETLTEMRSKYWLIRGRQFIRKLVYECETCRRFEGKPYQAPPAPPLPEFRLKEAPPFTSTGVDFLGPLYVKAIDRSQKVWICLYTCCVVRAVHLDVVPNLTSEGFMRSFRRFTARRGIPSTIVSDNGGTFKPASREITSILNHPDVKQFFAGRRITWIFNLAKAPWWGGFFERLVKSTKRCLKKTIGGAKLTYEELLTVTAEVEMILNSRPLSYVSTEDLDEPLTPSHLLTGRRLLSLPDQNSSESSDYEADLDANDLTRRMKHLSNVMNHFWNRWREEYLLELRESHRFNKTDGSGTVGLGDIVVVHDESRPRGLWRLARVEKLITGADGSTRGAVVRVSSRKRRPTTIKRPVQRLYPLEIHSATTEHKLAVKEGEDDYEEDDEPEVPRTRPRRAAAVEAEKRRRQWIKELE